MYTFLGTWRKDVLESDIWAESWEKKVSQQG